MNQVDGRTKRKIEAMRRVQEAALPLFEKRGFENVTVEEVAQAAQVGAASVYRNFGTKEQLALWDEYDPLLFEAIATQLKGRSTPLVAIRDGLIAALAEVYADDAKRILRRAKLIEKTPALRAQAVVGLQAMREGLAAVLKAKVRDELERGLLAAVVTSALDVAISNWAHARGAKPLASELKRVFALLESLR